MQLKTVFSVLAVLSTSVFAQNPSPGNTDTVDVIVRFKPSPDQVGHRRFAAHGALRRSSLKLVGAEVYTVNTRDLALLATDPQVEHFSIDHPLHATAATLDATPDYGWMTVSSLLPEQSHSPGTALESAWP